MKLTTTFITLNNGTQICVPENLKLMSNFVLREQGDWFEDEIHFVRKFIEPEMITLDIGANYGLYSTAIAENLGANGKLWCFEPTQNTADALRKTISKNNFDSKIELIQAGLSDHNGHATFYTSPNSELNSLTANDSTTGEKQTIELLTLDGCFDKYQWKQIDFIKLDAEGEELNILKAATNTLSSCSPLIMFELKHGKAVNIPLINAFKQLDYQPYYLIPALNVLCPLDLSQKLDDYQLNLFCCKKETADKLAQKGLLVTDPFSQKTKPSNPKNTFFQSLPFSKDIQLSETSTDEPSNIYNVTFDAYASSRDDSQNVAERLQHLFMAFEGVKKILAAGESKITRLSTLARISYDLGQRSVGNQILSYIMQRYIEKGESFELCEAFIPPSKVFESTSTNKKHNKEWLLSSVVHELICKHAYSCYFSGADATKQHFSLLEKYGFLLPDMAKRKNALEKAYL